MKKVQRNFTKENQTKEIQTKEEKTKEKIKSFYKRNIQKKFYKGKKLNAKEFLKTKDFFAKEK
jgi:hypothetical protein